MNKLLQKTLSAFCVSAIVFAAVSCGEKNETADPVNEPEVTVMSSAADTAEPSSLQTDFSDEDDIIDPSALSYDFSGLDSREYIEIFADAHYTLQASITQDQIELSQIMYVDAANRRILFNYKNPAYEMSNYICDGGIYYISQGKYFKMDISGDQEQIINSFAIYKKCGYIGSGKKELGGVSYKYDEFYDLEQERSFMVLMNSENGLEGILDAGMFTRVKSLSRDFDESVFDVLGEMTEITQQEFGELMASLNGAQPDN